MSSAVSCELETVLEPYESVRSGRKYQLIMRPLQVQADVSGRTADLDRRVEEDDISRLGPRVRVVGRVEPAVRDGAGAELEEETSSR